MASRVRAADTANEKALLLTIDVRKMTALLQKGVCPNVYEAEVSWLAWNWERERECEEEREDEEREFGTFSLLFLNVNVFFRTV